MHEESGSQPKHNLPLLHHPDWAKSSLGLPLHWPSALQHHLRLLHHSTFPMVLFWGKEALVFYNQAFVDLAEPYFNHPQPYGKSALHDFPESWITLTEAMREVYRTGKSLQEAPSLYPFNHQPLQFHWSPVWEEEPVGVLLTLIKTSPPPEWLNELETSRDELAFAVNAAELGTWDLNPQTLTFTANQRLKDWFGFDNNEIIDLEKAIQGVSPGDRRKVREALNAALQFPGGGKYALQHGIIHSGTGKERMVRARGKVLFNEAGEAYRVNGTLQDITEEIYAQNAYKASEENFRQLILQAPVGILLLKTEMFLIEMVNDTFLQLTGKQKSELKGRVLWDVFPEAREMGFEAILKRVLGSGKGYRGSEQPYTRTSGQTLERSYLSFVFEPLKDSNYSFNRIMVIAIDVTSMIEYQQKIKDAEERARLAIEASGSGTWDLDIQTNEMNTSERFDQLFGLHHKGTRAQYIEAIHPDDHRIRLEAHRRALLVGTIFYEVRVIWKDNSVHWLRIEGRLYRNADGRPVRMLGTVIDITQQRQAKEALIETNRRLEIAIDAGNFGLYELDMQHYQMKCSDQLLAIYGRKSGSTFTYTDYVHAIDPKYKKIVLHTLQEAILQQRSYHMEYPITWPDGSQHWIRESGKAKYEENGKALSYVGVTFDITEHKQLQQQKDDFIGIASHELKTPVTSIKAYAQLLERILGKKGNHAEASLMRKMDSQLNRLTSLITDLLDVTKVNAGKLQYNYTYFDLDELITSVGEEVQRTTDTHEILFHLDSAGLIYSDKERISQVLINLISNAIKYSPYATKVVITSERHSEEVRVSIRDFGIGISEDKLGRVFEQFYRVSGDVQHTFPGLGLGLYISSEIIRREGGRIWVYSTENKGSTFIFSLPLKKHSDTTNA